MQIPDSLPPPSGKTDSVSPAPSSSWTTLQTAQVLLDLVMLLVVWTVVVGVFQYLTRSLPSASPYRLQAV